MTASGVVAQLGHLPAVLFFRALKTCASLKTGTFMLDPSAQVTTPAGALFGGEPV